MQHIITHSGDCNPKELLSTATGLLSVIEGVSFFCLNVYLVNGRGFQDYKVFQLNHWPTCPSRSLSTVHCYLSPTFQRRQMAWKRNKRYRPCETWKKRALNSGSGIMCHLSNIYNAALNLLSRHFHSHPHFDSCERNISHADQVKAWNPPPVSKNWRHL